MRPIFTIVIGVLVAACSGSGADAPQLTAQDPAAVATIQGKLTDQLGAPVVGARVSLHILATSTLSGAPVATFVSLLDGSFLVQAPAGNYQLCVTVERSEDGVVQDVTVHQQIVQAAADEEINLDTIEVQAIVDTDLDGIANGLESSGWSILVDEDGVGRRVTRLVSSDPNLDDTDFDGIPDAEEFAARSDPRRADTDGDLLSDFDEIRVYKSQPNSVDTDGDAFPAGALLPNPALFDGLELMLSGTSPTLADTDGDGQTDYEEIIGGGFNPLVAEVPRLDLEVTGDPAIALNVAQTEDETISINTLRRDQSEQSRTDTELSRETLSFREFLGVETSASVDISPVGIPKGGSVSVKTNVEFEAKQEFVEETSTSFTRASARETQRAIDDARTTGKSFSDGSLAIALNVRNTSDRTVEVTDLSVIAFRRLPSRARSASRTFALVALLEPGSAFEAVVLPPGGEFSFVAENKNIALGLILPLLDDPSSLFFEVANFTLKEVDAFGVGAEDFAATGERVAERCGMVAIDFGDGEVKREMVATNVRRSPDGKGIGLPLVEILGDVIGQDFETTVVSLLDEDRNPIPGETVEILTRIGDKDTFKNADGSTGFWAVSGTGPQFDGQNRVNFSAIALMPGSRINLIYLQDRDGDGLFDREEFYFGTDRENPDSDSDGLTDGLEARTGWDVFFFEETDTGARVLYSPATRRVFSDPLRQDSDGDFLSDKAEFEGAETIVIGLETFTCSTDPNDFDTDDDFRFDNVDDFPCDRPDPLLVPTNGLLVHYSFSEFGDPATSARSNVLDGSDQNNPGVANRAFFGFGVSGDFAEDFGVFRYTDRFGLDRGAGLVVQKNLLGGAQSTNDFARIETDEDKKIEIARGATPELRGFTIATWVRVHRAPELNVEAPIAAFTTEVSGGDDKLWGGLILKETGGLSPKSEVRFDVPLPGGGKLTVPAAGSPFQLEPDKWYLVVGTVALEGTTGEVIARLYVTEFGALEPVEIGNAVDGFSFDTFEGPEGGMVLKMAGFIPEDSVNALETAHVSIALDEVRIYRRPLDPDDIESLFRELPR